VKLYQPKRGFRFGTDTFLLADFVRIKERGDERLIDLGTGCGVIPILLLLKYEKLRAVGVDVLPQMTNIAQKNAHLNGLSDRFEAICLNVKGVKDAFAPASFTVVVSNPPFIERGSGKVAEPVERAVARQEIAAELKDFIRAAAYLLKERGRFYLLLPTTRFVDAISLCRESRLEPKRLRFIAGREGAKGQLFLLEAVKGAGKGLEVEPPLVVYKDAERKVYTQEVKRKYEEFLGEER